MTKRHRTLRSPFVPLSILLVSCAFSGRLAAQDSQVGIAVQLAEPAPQAFQVDQGTDFTVRPSVTSSTVGAGVQTLPLIVFCFDIFTGQIIPNCNVVLTHRARALSGGHNHDANRPRGTFQPASGNTGPTGQLPTTYTSPEPSGIIETTITGTTSDGRPLIPGTFTIGVEIDGLAALGAGANYDLVGATATHGDNHNGTPTFNASLGTLADSYVLAFPGQRLAYNDMSLPLGGLFDINATWAPPHVSHRFGVDCDLRLVPPQQRRRVRQLIAAAGIGTIIVEGNHWHIRQ
jgi:hypothetical protein